MSQARRQIERAAGEKDEQADAGQVKPVLRDGGVELEEIRDRQETDENQTGAEDPARAGHRRASGNPRRANAAKSKPAIERYSDRDRTLPGRRTAIVVAIHHSAFHVQIGRENHQAPVVAERAQHQDRAHRRTPALSTDRSDRGGGKLVQPPGKPRKARGKRGPKRDLAATTQSADRKTSVCRRKNDAAREPAVSREQSARSEDSGQAVRGNSGSRRCFVSRRRRIE